MTLRRRVPQPSIWGWRSPWSGDEREPIPRSYWWWYRLHVFNQQFWHLLRACKWRPYWGPHGRVFYRCDWCGRIR